MNSVTATFAVPPVTFRRKKIYDRGTEFMNMLGIAVLVFLGIQLLKFHADNTNVPAISWTGIVDRSVPGSTGFELFLTLPLSFYMAKKVANAFLNTGQMVVLLNEQADAHYIKEAIIPALQFDPAFSQLTPDFFRRLVRTKRAVFFASYLSHETFAEYTFKLEGNKLTASARPVRLKLK